MNKDSNLDLDKLKLDEDDSADEGGVLLESRRDSVSIDRSEPHAASSLLTAPSYAPPVSGTSEDMAVQRRGKSSKRGSRGGSKRSPQPTQASKQSEISAVPPWRSKSSWRQSAPESSAAKHHDNNGPPLEAQNPTRPHLQPPRFALASPKSSVNEDDANHIPPSTVLPLRIKERSGMKPPFAQQFSTSTTNHRGPDWTRGLAPPSRSDIPWGPENYTAKAQRVIYEDPIIELPPPPIKWPYLEQASRLPARLSRPQRLLLVLDLNGTLIHRAKASRKYTARPHLDGFLRYCFAEHAVMIWSTATPKNVNAICKNLFSERQHELLLSRWGRDRFDLSAHLYKSRVTVYKNLDTVWNSLVGQGRFPSKFDDSDPDSNTLDRWGQHNTILIDDSPYKAAAQPYNHLEVPEFKTDTPEAAGKASGKDKNNQKGENDLGAQQSAAMKEKQVLESVIAKLEEARKWSDVSAFVKANAVPELPTSPGMKTAITPDEEDKGGKMTDGEQHAQWTIPAFSTKRLAKAFRMLEVRNDATSRVNDEQEDVVEGIVQ